MLIVPAVAPHAMYTIDAATLRGVRGAGAQVRRAGADSPGRDRGRGRRRRARAHQMTPDGVSRVDRLLGTADAGGARRLGGRRGHRDSEAPRRRRLAQPGKQHEAGERHGAGRRVPGRRRDASASAPTAPRATTTSTCSRRCGRRRSSPSWRRAIPTAVPGAGRARHGDDRRRARRSGWTSMIGSLEPGKRADLITRRRSIAARQTPTVRSGVAPGLRDARRRRADDDRERQGADAGPAACARWTRSR